MYLWYKMLGGRSAPPFFIFLFNNPFNLKQQNEELPNIKGVTTSAGWGNWGGVSGSFTNSSRGGGPSGSSGDNMQTISFDASKGQIASNGSYVPQANSTYKNGGKVTPINSAIQLWKRIN